MNFSTAQTDPSFDPSHQKPFFSFSRYGWLITAVLAGIFLPLLVMGVLPQIGVSGMNKFLQPKLLVLLIAGALSSVFMWVYLKYLIHKPPIVLMLFMGVYFPVVNYVTSLMIEHLGINIHFRLLLMGVMSVAVLLTFFKHGFTLIRDLPYLKYFLFFFALVSAYVFFYNGASYDANVSREGSFLEGNMSMVKVINYYMALMGIAVSWLSFHKVSDKAALFDHFNKHLIWVTTAISVVSLIAYPLNQLSMMLDGFHRSTGLTGHPALYSSHMGIVMTYFLGLFCYYQGANKERMPTWLLYMALVVNFLGFLIGFSKTGLADFSLCLALTWLFNFSNPDVRRVYFRGGIFLVGVIILALTIFSFTSEQSLIEIIQKRMEDTNSLHARQSRWEILLSNLNEDGNWLYGHGISAANAQVLAHWFNRLDGKPSTMIHNGYLELIYDFGILGYSFFVAVFSLMLQAVRRILSGEHKAANPLMFSVIVITIYYLVEMAFGEVMMMFDICILYWMFLTILLCVWKYEPTHSASYVMERFHMEKHHWLPPEHQGR